MFDPTSTLHNIRTEMRDLLTKHIAFDAYCISTVDPLTLLPTGALTSSSIEFIHNQLLRNEYFEKDNIAKILHIDKPNETRLKDILHPANIGDELRFPLFFKDQCWGIIHLFRRTEALNFTEEDLTLLATLSSSFAKKIKNAQNKQFVENQGQVHLGTIITDLQLNVIYSNEQGLSWLNELKSMEHVETKYMPRSFQGLLARLEIDKAPSKRLVLNSAEVGYFQIRAEKLQGYHSKEVIAFHFESISSEDRYNYAKSQYLLSKRENDVTDCVIKGYTTKQIAETLFISFHTAQDHLKSIFRKVNVHTRRDLIIKLTGRTSL